MTTRQPNYDLLKDAYAVIDGIPYQNIEQKTHPLHEIAELAEKILIATCASDLSESAVERINGSFYLAEEFLEEVFRRRRNI